MWSSIRATAGSARPSNVTVTDILELPFEKLNLDEPIKTGSKNLNPMQVGVQMIETVSTASFHLAARSQH